MEFTHWHLYSLIQSPTFVSRKIGGIPLIRDKLFQGRVHSTSKVFEMTLSRNVVRKDSAISWQISSTMEVKGEPVFHGGVGVVLFWATSQEKMGGQGGGGPHLDQIPPPPPPPLTTCRFGRCRSVDERWEKLLFFFNVVA